jgi:3-hydroxybutyryl-CoA dehydrogenase
MEYASTVEHAAREADLVIEAVPDELESKTEIFILLDKICRPQTILVSNTTTLSLTEIASVTYRAPRIAGMRFAEPIFTSKNLQVVRARLTNDETIAACTEVGRRMGKQVVVITESGP